MTGWRIEYLDETGSTNDAARGAGYGHGDVVAADVQTTGRGQRGASWHSEKGRNLTFSVVLEPEFLPAGRSFLLSEAVSLAIADALGEYGIGAHIKWPNDIYVGGRKTAGILIENDIKGGAVSRSIVGIGLNVNQTVFDRSLPNPTSMRLATGCEYDRRQVLDTFLAMLGRRYGALSSGLAGGIERDYHECLYRISEPSEFLLPDGTSFIGTVSRVEQSGELVVEHPDGATSSFLFKEIEFAP